MSSKNVYFYKLTICRSVEMSHNKYKQNYMTSEEVLNVFDDVYEKMKGIKGGRKAIKVQYNKKPYVVEVISRNSQVIFGRIGNVNPSNTVLLRNADTLESAQVPMKANQHLEVFTYFLIDFSNCIVSYIGSQNAPSIRVLVSLFEIITSTEDKLVVNIVAILTRNILEMLANKKSLGTIKMTVSVPSDNVLADEIGIGKQEFKEVMNLYSSEKTIVLRPKRGTSIADINVFNKFVELIRSKNGNTLRKLTVSAKSEGEEAQIYDILENKFTVKASLSSDKDDFDLTENDFYLSLYDTYRRNKSDLDSLAK